MNKFCPICGKPTNTAGNCPDWSCNRYNNTPVLPQKILKLKYPIWMEDKEFALAREAYIMIQSKLNEIIDVINDMKRITPA